MEEASRERVFDPFVTSKENGTGLGLPIVKRIIDAHGGRIELSSTSSEGTEFVLGFPKNGAPGGGRS
jgi:signal transduction histidine kinase